MTGVGLGVGAGADCTILSMQKEDVSFADAGSTTKANAWFVTQVMLFVLPPGNWLNSAIFPVIVYVFGLFGSRLCALKDKIFVVLSKLPSPAH